MKMMLRCIIAVIIAISECSTFAHSKSIAERIGALNDKNTTEVAEKVFHRLDQVENAFRTAWKWTQSHRRIVKAGAGVLI